MARATRKRKTPAPIVKDGEAPSGAKPFLFDNSEVAARAAERFLKDEAAARTWANALLNNADKISSARKLIDHALQAQMGLIPPPWWKKVKWTKKTARRQREGKVGHPPDYDYAAIQGVGKELLKLGVDKTKTAFFERVRNACDDRNPRILTPQDWRGMNRIVGGLYDEAAREGAIGAINSAQ